MYNKDLLKYLMAQRHITQETAADTLDMSRQSFSKRINGEIEFKLNEIQFLQLLCKLTDQEVMDIFFAKSVN